MSEATGPPQAKEDIVGLDAPGAACALLAAHGGAEQGATEDHKKPSRQLKEQGTRTPLKERGGKPAGLEAEAEGPDAEAAHDGQTQDGEGEAMSDGAAEAEDTTQRLGGDVGALDLEECCKQLKFCRNRHEGGAHQARE